MFTDDRFLGFHHPFIDRPIGVGEVAGLPFAADALGQPVTDGLLGSLYVTNGDRCAAAFGQIGHVLAARFQIVGSIKDDALSLLKPFFDDGITHLVNQAHFGGRVGGLAAHFGADTVGTDDNTGEISH